jgi:hypothetical protein
MFVKMISQLWLIIEGDGLKIHNFYADPNTSYTLNGSY